MAGGEQRAAQRPGRSQRRQPAVPSAEAVLEYGREPRPGRAPGPAARLRGGGHLVELGQAQRRGLLDQHTGAGLQAAQHLRVVDLRRRAHLHEFRPGLFQQAAEVAVGAGDALPAAELLEPGLVDVGGGHDLGPAGEFAQGAGVDPGDVAGPDDGGADRPGRAC